MNAPASKMTTLRDVARKARVSISTVSRALSAHTRNRISASVCARIQHAADALGYQPNRSARALSRGGSDTIALVIPASAHAYFAESEYYAHIVIGAVAALSAKNLDVKVHMLRSGESRQRFSFLIRQLGVDGLLVAGVSLSDHFEIDAGEPAPPVVMLNSYVEPSVTTVDADNQAGGRLAVDHLLAAGHRAIALLAGPRDNYDAQQRVLGARERLREAGCVLSATECLHSVFGKKEGYQIALRLLRRTPRPTALFCANDELALGALHAMRDLNLRCPADVSLVGFDNISATALADPPLTTIAQPLDQIVTVASEYLLKRLSGDPRIVRVLLPVTLVARASVAGPKSA
ncbi:MAG: LacI family DNA-binding transcriptional regulator [bacterium]|nr:LacI family DNA-binding transcriptional regulator [bacterium]